MKDILYLQKFQNAQNVDFNFNYNDSKSLQKTCEGVKKLQIYNIA